MENNSMNENMMGIMSKMMGDNTQKSDSQPGTGSDMMLQMFANGPMMMMQNMPKEKRLEFIPKMLTILFDKGCADLSAEEKRGMLNSVLETIE